LSLLHGGSHCAVATSTGQHCSGLHVMSLVENNKETSKNYL